MLRIMAAYDAEIGHAQPDNDGRGLRNISSAMLKLSSCHRRGRGRATLKAGIR